MTTFSPPSFPYPSRGPYHMGLNLAPHRTCFAGAYHTEAIEPLLEAAEKSKQQHLKPVTSVPRYRTESAAPGAVSNQTMGTPNPCGPASRTHSWDTLSPKARQKPYDVCL